MSKAKEELGTWMKINILGIPVEIVRNKGGQTKSKTANPKDWFCAYVTIKGAHALRDNFFMGSVTYREYDTLGIDTNHMYNQGELMEEKLRCALTQITGVIEQCQGVLESFDDSKSL